MTERSTILKHWLKIGLVGITLPLLAFVALSLVIGFGVKGAVSHAQSNSSGDPVIALIEVATDEDAGLSDRTRAVWALGQLGDSRALPILQSLSTGEPCDHRKRICQREVGNAIKGCGDGINIGAVIWRHGELAVGGEN